MNIKNEIDVKIAFYRYFSKIRWFVLFVVPGEIIRFEKLIRRALPCVLLRPLQLQTRTARTHETVQE